MSSEHELERRLREARQTLPEPGPEASRRACERAVAASALRRPRRTALAVAGALVCMVVLAGAVGALVAPSGTAARAIGLGFLPEPGWHALQAATPATPSQPQVAMSANVPFAVEDVVLGEADPSGLPYSTLLTLPRNGIVIVATFTESKYVFLPRGSDLYPERRLPLRMRDALPISYGTQVRPEEPLGQYQLRAAIERWSVDVHVYFGKPRPSAAQRAAAEAQLERLVVRRALAGAVEARSTRPAVTAAPSAPVVIDRTLACRPSLIGGIRQIDAVASAGSGRTRSGWSRPSYAGFKTTVSGSAATIIDEHLVWVAAGRPASGALISGSSRFMEFPYRVWGTLAVNRVLCRSTSARVPITPRGLRGGPVGGLEEQWDCATPRTVLVRVRAVAQTGTALRSYRSFVRTAVPLKEATIVVQTPGGRRLALARVLESGRSLLYTAPSCFPD